MAVTGGFQKFCGSQRGGIRRAVMAAEQGGVVLVAGKGHEDYQIIGSERRHFDDCEQVADALAQRSNSLK